MKAVITGTLSELNQLWSWDVLCELVHVDYYKRCMVPETEEFTVTESDLARQGLISSPPTEPT